MVKKKKNINTFLRVLEKDKVLDPPFLRYITEYKYLENISIRLIEVNKKGDYVPQLAKEILTKNNQKDFYITLKKSFFSDGTRITAHDVIMSFKRLLVLGAPHSDPKSYIRGAHKINGLKDNTEIEGLREIDQETVFIGLKFPMKEIYYYLSLTDFSILHSNQYEKDKLFIKDWTKNCSGAYCLEIDQKTGKAIFKANEKSILFNNKMPHRIIPNTISEKKTIKEFAMGNFHFGGLTFGDYVKLKDYLTIENNIELYGHPMDGIVSLVLNLKSKIFKKNNIRQWVQKKTMTHFNILEKEKSYMKKANQYFLPTAKGYVKNADTLKLLDHIDISKIPKELKNGFTITTLTTMKDYHPPNLAKRLTNVLGIPIKVNMIIDRKDLITFLKKREFEGFTIATSMAYKILGEAINLIYTSENPFYLDPTGKIKRQLKIYQSTEDLEEETNTIRIILKQMILDAECIPLFYYPSPNFAKEDVLDFSNVNTDESIQFWKINVL